MSLLAWCRSAAHRVSGLHRRNDLEATATHLIADGNRLEELGQFDAAERCYVEAVRLVPGMARAHLSLGNILVERDDPEAAFHAYTAALALQPGYAAAHYNLGNVHARLHRPQMAVACYQQAILLKPDFADAEVALGNTQEDLQQLEEAVGSYARALQIRPDYARVYYNLSNVLRKLGRLEEATESCLKALELAPDLAEAYNNLGIVLAARRDLLGAKTAFDSAVEKQADFGAAAVQSYHCANQLCDWGHRRAAEVRLVDMVNRAIPNIAPFSLLCAEPEHAEAALLQRQASQHYAQALVAAVPPLLQAGAARRDARRRLRIGYLSADFHDHATMHLLQGVLRAHDRATLAIHAYSYGPTRDAVTEIARQQCDVFRDLTRLSDSDAAAAIAFDGIDILVDLKGFTQNFRIGISALRPAPVVVSWLGYPGTLGVPALADYIVGDPVVTPPEHAVHFSEKLALMPHCYQPNDRHRVVGPKPSRRLAGLPDEGFVFASFNQSYKLNPHSFDVWCRLLAQVPASVLWLLAPTEAATANLQREAMARDIDPKRLIFASTVSPAEHLGRLQLADLVLDTFPYNSHTTGSDALWAGVPMVTRLGSTFASRVAASLLTAVGLPELVTHGWDGYFELARALAHDPRRLQGLRETLAANRLRAPLFDTTRFTRDLERLYVCIWEQHTHGVKEMIVLRDLDES